MAARCDFMLIPFSSFSLKGLAFPSLLSSKQPFLVAFTTMVFSVRFPFLKGLLLVFGLSEATGAELLRGRTGPSFIPGDLIVLDFLGFVGSLWMPKMDLGESLSHIMLLDIEHFEALFSRLFWRDSLGRFGDWGDTLVILCRPFSSAELNVFFPLTVLADRADLVTLSRFIEIVDVDLLLIFDTRHDLLPFEALFPELFLRDSFGRVEDWLDAFVAVRRPFCSAAFNVFFPVGVLAGRAVVRMI